jgi:hypothetical protein
MDYATPGNWLEAQQLGWSLHHVESLLPTAPIVRGQAGPRRFTARPSLDPAAFCAQTHTDGLLVMRGGTVLFERYFGMTAETPHLVMSVSKSVCGMLAGIAAAAGELDLTATTAAYVPELGPGPYGAATVTDLLDMTAVLRYDMDHTDPDSEVAAEDRAAGWRPLRPGDPAGGSRDFLRRLRHATDGAHGKTLQYSSATTEVLSWVLERAAGVPYAQLVSDRLWSRMGAEHDAYVTVDSTGTPYACAGLGMTLRDLARFGRLILDRGRYADQQIIPADWITQTFGGGDPALAGDHPFREYLPGGSYHNQWWITGYGPMYAAGLLGQYLWLDPAADVIIAKFSCVPVEADQRAAHVAGFQAITDAVTAL